ncbi:MAG: hypothetical protein ACE3L7_05015 [Candidatus Pristimantibacillus sp.]
MMAQNSQDNHLHHSIYVLLTDTGTRFTRLIKEFTNAPYNHASLALDAELNEVFSFGRKVANNPLIAGFVREDLYNGTFRQFPNTRCKLLQLRMTEQQHTDAIQIIRDFQKKQHMYRYNLIGLLGVLLKLDLKTDHAFFCSQFVAETLRESGLQLWDRPSTLVTPNDFLEHPQFEAVYEGLLYDYQLLDRGKLSYTRTVPTTAIRMGKQTV